LAYRVAVGIRQIDQRPKQSFYGLDRRDRRNKMIDMRPMKDRNVALGLDSASLDRVMVAEKRQQTGGGEKLGPWQAAKLGTIDVAYKQ
jgi:hypothetical protein